ncbi:MAG: tetratricopeptide repeat protein [Thermoplasmata archaeon]
MEGSEEDSLKALAKRDVDAGNYQDAFDKYLKLTTIDPTNYLYKYRAGLQLFRMGKYQEALKFYKDSLQIYEQKDNPVKIELAALHGIIGDCYRSLGQQQSAITEYEEALKIDPSPKTQQKYKTKIKETKNSGKRKVNNAHKGEHDTILGLVFDVVSIILLVLGSMLPLVSYKVNINGTVSNTVSPNIFSFNYEIGAQIIFALILLSMVVFLILDFLVLVLTRHGDLNSVLKYYKGAGPSPLAVILGTIIFLLLSYGEVLVYNPISNFIEKSTEHIGLGLFIIISAMVIYFFRAAFQTNKKYVPYNSKRKKLQNSN